MVEAEIWTIARTDQGNTLLLRPLGSDITIPILIGPFETQSILIGFDDVPVERPLTHDLFLNLVGRMNLFLIRVEVSGIKDDIFYARLIFAPKGSAGIPAPVVLDARPSDALALAVRVHCPVLVAQSVIDQAGVPTDLIIEEIDKNAFVPPPEEEADTNFIPSPPPKRVAKAASSPRSLRDDLDDAVAAEEYERAAKIRDMIILLDQEKESL